MRTSERDAKLVYHREIGSRTFTFYDVSTGVWGKGRREVRVAVVTIHGGSMTKSATVRVESGAVFDSKDLPQSVNDEVGALLMGARPLAR